MDAIDAILTRKSVRKFTQQPIEADKLHLLLEAAMSAPSATNARDWAYIVVSDHDMMQKMADGNGKYAQPLRGAATGILICGDMRKAVRTAEDFWVIDGAIAAENLCLCAHALGLGAVWLGTWPREDAVKAQRELFALPEYIIPHSIIALGYPQETAVHERPSRYDETCVHMERW